MWRRFTIRFLLAAAILSIPAGAFSAPGDPPAKGKNKAPILKNDAGQKELASIPQNDMGNAGTNINDVIGNSFSDADQGAKKGIAVTQVDNSNGVWQYTTNGGSSWSDFGKVGLKNGTLLGGGSQAALRFIPNADYIGPSNITFHAWDQTGGKPGDTNADLSERGGDSPFSGDSNKAKIDVDPEIERGEFTNWGQQVTEAVRKNNKEAMKLFNLAVKTKRAKGTALESVLRGLPNADPKQLQDLLLTAVDEGLTLDEAKEVVENLGDEGPCP